MSVRMEGSFYTGNYRNVFLEAGYPEQEIQNRVEQAFDTLFYGSEEERIYHPAEVDFSDPSYHLPHFYELFARWALEEDRAFFALLALSGNYRIW